MVDKRVEDKIAEVLSEGVTRIFEVDKVVYPFCQKEFRDLWGQKPRDSPNFPSRETIGVCMSRLKMKFRLSKLENDDMTEMVNS